VVAIGVGFADPQFADYAAIGQRLIHIALLKKWSPLLGSVSGGSAVPESQPLRGYAALQQEFDVEAPTETLIRKKRIPTKGLPQMLCAI
jgi:hypothetical protein